MNLSVPFPRFCQYVLAIECEYALREYAELGAPSPVSPLTFLHTHDPERELSIVMPIWNPQPKQLERALRSIAEQDFGDIRYEVVICDDASKEDIVQKVVDRVGLSHVRYHRHAKNIGGIPNFNWAYTEARGTWLHMLHQDDWVAPSFYRALLRGAAADSDTDLRFCRTRLCDEDTGQTRLMFDEAPTAGVLDAFMERQTVSQRLQFAGTLVSRKAVETIGGFNPEIGAAADWEFWARVGSQFRVFYHPGQLATYSLHAGSWSNGAAAGFADARAFERYRILLRYMLAYSAPNKRRATAAGLLQNMFLRMMEKAVQHRQQGKAAASIPLGNALFQGCKQAGVLPDIEKILFGVGNPSSPVSLLDPAKASI